ncbi:hypothetical protein BKA61DRAFT_298532 [Leptodontidium sp. MPI-SDFR-AT-0119]|nr:hypothetical protein BKA61DRAFT_298532 [Leptodontidium sp. MPI-SDFR-AT-0119]
MGEGTKAKRCNTCAKRKIACDLKDPACSQCLLTGREFPGYHQPHVFLHQAFGTPSAKSGKQKVVASRVSRGKSQKAGLQKASSSTTGHRPIHHRAVKYTISNIAAPALSADGLLIQLIIGNFASSHEIGLVHIGDNSLVSLNSRMCGAWVTLLPELFAKSATRAGVLCIGARALGTAISGRLEKDESLIAESLDLVCRGLRALRELLISQEGASDVEVLSASMCLKITEVLLGTSHNGWSVHIHGIAELIKDRGPCNFVIGTAHQLFASFRIFLLLEYMQKRKSTFLASPEWLKVPFCNRSKSSMQTLLDAASPLPGLLEKVDKFRASQSVIEDSTAHEIHLELNAVVKDLRKWETDLTSALEGSLWWPVSSPSSENTNSVDEEAGFTIFYQFANILTANTMCHYWAFLAIALSEISLLEPCIQHLRQHEIPHAPVPKTLRARLNILSSLDRSSVLRARSFASIEKKGVVVS